MDNREAMRRALERRRREQRLANEDEKRRARLKAGKLRLRNYPDRRPDE